MILSKLKKDQFTKLYASTSCKQHYTTLYDTL